MVWSCTTNPSMSDGLIRVLVVDDSAYLRKMISHMLRKSPLLDVVGYARDGVDALERVKELKPDVVTVDLNMPLLNGAEFVREQMKREPLAVVVVSIVSEDGLLAGQAMEAGAVEFVRKPTGLANEKVLEIERELVEKVIAAGRISRQRLRPIDLPLPPLQPVAKVSDFEVLVLGLSTGGPQALRFLLSQFPSPFPVPIAVVVHMPVGYTAPFAEKLNEISALEVKEASNGMVMQPGRVVLAQAGQHLIFRRRLLEVQCCLVSQPPGLLHRPSVDVLFESAANIYGKGTLGVVLTGMGEDGKNGSAWIKAQGGSVLAEHESSCVIYGMPRSVVEAGLADGVYPLPDLPRRIQEILRQVPRL